MLNPEDFALDKDIYIMQIDCDYYLPSHWTDKQI